MAGEQRQRPEEKVACVKRNYDASVPIASVIRYVNGSGGCVSVSDVWCGKGLGFSTDAVSMDHPRRNLPPSRRKIDVDKNNSNQTEFRMPFLITGQAIDWYRSLNIEDMLNAASPGICMAKYQLYPRHVLQFMESPEYNRFTHIVLDTTPTLKKKITAAASAFTSVFGKKEIQQQRPSNELDQLKERMEKVLNVFSEVDTTEFVIVTIAPFSYLFIRSLVYMCGTKGTNACAQTYSGRYEAFD
uniref:Uncharacterized protein n=1 Tax=Brassica oleracea var. oleracea TaxID=109376 RepID=A0A0D3D615_BRAOL